MSESRAAFLEAYDENRVKDQQHFYKVRTAEYEKSAKQIGWVNVVLLALAGLCGAAGAVWSDQATWLGLTAVALSAIAAATASWGDVVGFSTNAELYKAAQASLAHLRAQEPKQDADDDQVGSYVRDVEDVLLGEVRTWGERWGKKAEELDLAAEPPAEAETAADDE